MTAIMATDACGSRNNWIGVIKFFRYYPAGERWTMAEAAVIAGAQMVTGLAVGRCMVAIVAGEATPNIERLAMIHRCWLKGRGIMARIAVVGAGDMGWRFPGRIGCTRMTGYAVGYKVGVIRLGGGFPVCRIVTVFTGIWRRNVSSRLARRIGVIVAGKTATHDAGMVKLGWLEGRCGMAIFTEVAGR